MSQPLNFGPDQKDPLGVALTKIEQLEQVFYDCEVQAGHELMGIEYELFGHDKLNNQPVQYEGPLSITTLFNYLVGHSKDIHDPWQAILEEGENNIVAVTNKQATIALEPGGQIEIAAKPHNNLNNMNQSFMNVLNELHQAAEACSIDLFAVGIHPLATRDMMARVKKNRYVIMRDYMQERRGLGLDMMTRTCSIQLNLDFINEADMVKKTRLAACLIPVYSLLCSSSAFLEGKPTTHALERCFIWQQTDRDRTGIPPLIFAPDFGYRAWIEYALDVPMYFIRRGTTYINVAGASFRDFMRQGLKNQQALVRDFVDHLSTIFAEIRLKPFIELRSCDALPGAYVTALSALTWEIFYNPTILQKALDLFSHITYDELINFHKDTINHGRNAVFRGKKIFDQAHEILDLGRNNLYTKPFENLVVHNTTGAEWQKERYKFMTPDKLPDLIAHFGALSKPIF